MITLKSYTLAEVPELGAAKFGQRPALSMVGGVVFSYRDFDRISKNIAKSLLASGVKKGERIALLAENSPLWVMTYFGILRAGAIVVPILNDFIPAQICNIIEHAGARMVFTSDKLRSKLSQLPKNVAIIDLKKPNLASAETEVVFPSISTDDLAMIVYTSGTTGLSKGVMLSHRNILSDATACKSIIVLHRTDRLLSILPLTHTYEFTIGTVIPLISGSHISYLDRPPSATVLIPALQAVKPTIMLSVPLVIEKIYRSSIKPTLEGMKLYKNKLFQPLILLFAGMKLKKT